VGNTNCAVVNNAAKNKGAGEDENKKTHCWVFKGTD
jgi:hypothetical protein